MDGHGSLGLRPQAAEYVGSLRSKPRPDQLIVIYPGKSGWDVPGALGIIAAHGIADLGDSRLDVDGSFHRDSR
jgi:hypothetical protein